MGRSVNGIGVVDTVHSANTGTTTSTRYIQVQYYNGSTGTGSGGKYTLKLAW